MRRGYRREKLKMEEVASSLVIQVKRFNQVGVVKSLCGVRFPLDGMRVGAKIYQLSALVYHKGSVASGHYKSVNRMVGGWVCCDDSKVSRVSARDVCALSKDVYLLFYKQVHV